MSVLNTIFSVGLVLGFSLLFFVGTTPGTLWLGIMLSAISISSLYLLEQRRRYYKALNRKSEGSRSAA
jgi:hypothetical protein